MNFIIGCDECGTGSLAGPLFVCGVKVLEDWTYPELNDSKKLTAKKRKYLSDKLLDNKDISYHIAQRSNKVIDKLGLAAALKDAYVEVFHALGERQPILIIVDGTLKFHNAGLEAYTIDSRIKADTKFPSVMAASIIAKHNRDMLMIENNKLYPEYNWNSNMGYRSAAHIKAIKDYGFSDMHRMSYKIKELND